MLAIVACLALMAVFIWFAKVASGGGDRVPRRLAVDEAPKQATNESPPVSPHEVSGNNPTPSKPDPIAEGPSLRGLGCMVILAGLVFLLWLYAQHAVGDPDPPDQFDAMPMKPR